MNDYNFGNFVCMLRENKGLTQQDVADMLGVSAAAVSKWENGSSKPRVELLFQLAKILGVRAEELMAGKFLNEETISDDTLMLINERYEHLIKIESYDSTKVKFKRLVSTAIDFSIAGALIYFVTLLAYKIAENIGMQSGTKALICIFTMWISVFLTLGLRDLIGFGKSLGKRIMGLDILDIKTGKDIGRGRKFLRNLTFVGFMFFSPVFIAVDAIIMITQGRSIGDKLVNAVVVNAEKPKKCRKVKQKENGSVKVNDNMTVSGYNGISASQVNFKKINVYNFPVASKNKIAIATMSVGVVLAMIVLMAITLFAALGFDTFIDLVNSFKYTDEMIEYMKNTPQNENVAYVDEGDIIYAHGKKIRTSDEIVDILYLTADHIFYVLGEDGYAKVYKSYYDFSEAELILSYDVDVFMIHMSDEDTIFYNVNGGKKDDYCVKHIGENRTEIISEEDYKKSWKENDYYSFSYVKRGNEILEIEITNNLTGVKKLINDEDKKEILKIEQAKKLNEYTDIGYKKLVLKGDEIYLSCHHFSIITVYLYDFETEQFKFIDWTHSDTGVIEDIYIFSH